MDPTEATSVSRRGAIRLAGTAGVALLAGCTEDVGEELPPNAEWPTSAVTPSLPVEKRTDVVARGIEEGAASSIQSVEAFANEVDGDGIRVAAVGEARDVLALEYVATGGDRTGVLHALGPIAGAYAALVDGGYGAVALAVTVLDGAREAYGSAEVETAWAEAYLAGTYTVAEYGELVAGTVESHRHDPDIEVDPAE